MVHDISSLLAISSKAFVQRVNLFVMHESSANQSSINVDILCLAENVHEIQSWKKKQTMKILILSIAKVKLTNSFPFGFGQRSDSTPPIIGRCEIMFCVRIIACVIAR